MARLLGKGHGGEGVGRRSEKRNRGACLFLLLLFEVDSFLPPVLCSLCSSSSVYLEQFPSIVFGYAPLFQ